MSRTLVHDYFYCRYAATISGSATRTRTWDMVVNSHPLYQLSYRGICWPQRILNGAAEVNLAAMVRGAVSGVGARVFWLGW